MTEKPLLEPGKPFILVVEDNPDDFEAVKRAFRKAGLSQPPTHAESGEAAVEYLRGKEKGHPNLVLLDLNMPGIGGRRALEIIKQDEKLRHIPIVVLTTSSYEADVSACYALGANTYIQKPVDYDVLCAAIKKIKEYWLETAVLPPEDQAGSG
jgi:two-component system response regulator